MRIVRTGFGLLATVLALAAASGAYAYIPPGQFIIKNMASKRTGIKQIRVVSLVNGYDSGKPNGQRFKAVTVYNALTRTMKSQALNDQGQELFGVEKTGEQLPLSLLVLYDPSPRDIIAALKRVDIPIHTEEEPPQAKPGAPGQPATEKLPENQVDDTTALRRWNGSVAWVLGLSPAHKDGSQIWVEKDTFLPARLLLGDQDIQFAKYRYSQDLAYPRTTTIANRTGVLQVEEDTIEIKVNPKDTERTAVANGYTDAGNSSAVKELIRKYYAGLR